MENRQLRLGLALVVALIGAYLLYIAGNPDSAPATAFWSLLVGGLLFLVTLYVLQRYYKPGSDEVSGEMR